MKSRSNLEVLLGYGTFLVDNLNTAEFKKLLESAYDAGYDYIDTAKYYNNESVIGEALELIRQERGEDFYFPVQTKVWTDDYLKTRESVLESLKKLRLPALDSVLLHRPSFNLVHDAYAWSVLIELQKEGLVKSIGVSNYDREMLDYLHLATGVYPEYNQVEFSVFNGRYDRFFRCNELGVKIQAWRPLTNDIEKLHNSALVQKLAEKHNTTPVGIALAYLKFFKIHPIVKSVNVDRLQTNAQSFFEVNLDVEDAKKLRGLNTYNIDDGSSTYPFSDYSSTVFLDELKELKATLEKHKDQELKDVSQPEVSEAAQDGEDLAQEHHDPIKKHNDHLVDE